jgi:hypothetical protein
MGMVLIYLLQVHLFGNPLPRTVSSADMYSLAVPASPSGTGSSHAKLNAFRRGEYDVMLRLMRMLDGGTKLKEEVDAAIDVCARVINLRHSILESYLKAETVLPVAQPHISLSLMLVLFVGAWQR